VEHVQENLTKPLTFFDPRDFSFLDRLTENFAVIQQEAQEAVKRYHYLLWRYGDLFSTRARGGVVGERATHYFKVYGMPLERNRRFSPYTSAIVEMIPGMVTAGFYILEPHSHIFPHVGATSDLLRGHLGVICPPGCSIRVGDEARSWAEQQFLVFDDTFEHEAWNESDECRCILLFDFFREEIPPASRANRLKDLRKRYILPRDYPWLLAAKPSAESYYQRLMEDTVARNPMVAGLSFPQIMGIVQSSGLYTP
jgi:aspartyl/asparaginyl beta-hydroxylase (cupin superfamily)